MKAFYTDIFVLPLPDGHRFPMEKYRLLREYVQAEIVAPDDLLLPPAATDAQLRLAHTDRYLEAVINGTLTKKEIRKIGFPWSDGMVERSRRSTGATIAACRAALADNSMAINLAGGTHHAYADSGGGYCVFNDAVVALRTMQAEHRIRRGVVIDCDVHHGDGTASLCAEDDSIFTFSIHGAKNYPFNKPPSDLDIGLADGASDDEYLDKLREGLWYSLSRAGAEIAIYLAGADPFVGDTLGRLSVSKHGLKQRDQLVLASCQQAGIPVAVVMAGGYAKNVQDTVDIHIQTVQTAFELGNMP